MIAESGKPLTQDQIETLISIELTAGLDYVYGPDNIAAERDRNYDYYRGIMNDLPAPKGRSQVTDRTVSSYIGLMKPSLLRIFTAGRNIAEYVSPKPDLEHAVRTVTRYVNDVVFRQDNRGELLLYDWCDDGLIQKLGTVKVWWEERSESEDQTLENIPDEAVVPLVQEALAQGHEVVEYTKNEGNGHSIKLRQKINKSKTCIEVIPPEEYVISRDARNDDYAVLQGHRTWMMVGDLIAQGIPLETVNELPTFTETYPNKAVKYNQSYTAQNNRDNGTDPMLRKVMVLQGILRCNADGQGIKEWYILASGSDASITLLEMEPYKAQVAFANFCPQPSPHTIYGRCPADDLSELQKIKTVLVRQMNDNLFLSNTPQREVVMDWIIKPDQLMNMAPGAPVLVKQPGAIREIAIPFVADKALVAMQYFDGEAEIRTGISRATAGLDADALQNQSATSASLQYSAMQGRLEMVARIWAQGGMRKLFRAVLKCIITYQDFARAVQIDGSPVQVNPQEWKGLEDLEVNINTGLGTGNRDRDLAMLQSVGTSQREAYTMLGPDNPVVSLKQIVRTEQLKAESAGINYPEKFFADPGDWKPQPQPPQPSPDTIVLAQVEQKKIDANTATDQAKMEFEREKAIAQIASTERTNREKNYWDALIKQEELGLQRSSLVIEAAKVDAAMIAKDFAQAQKTTKSDPSIIIHSDAKDGINAALDEVKGMAGKMNDSHTELTKQLAKLNAPRRIVRDSKGKALHSEIVQ